MSAKVRWSSKLHMYVPGRVLLTDEGLPVDAGAWTEQDWRDFHEAIQSALKKIRERHKCNPEAKSE